MANFTHAFPRKKRTEAVILNGNYGRFGLTPDRAQDYTEEQQDWLRAMDRLRAGLHRRPTWAEVLGEARRLGYGKTAKS